MQNKQYYLKLKQYFQGSAQEGETYSSTGVPWEQEPAGTTAGQFYNELCIWGVDLQALPTSPLFAGGLTWWITDAVQRGWCTLT